MGFVPENKLIRIRIRIRISLYNNSIIFIQIIEYIVMSINTQSYNVGLQLHIYIYMHTSRFAYCTPAVLPQSAGYYSY